MQIRNSADVDDVRLVPGLGRAAPTGRRSRVTRVRSCSELVPLAACLGIPDRVESIYTDRSSGNTHLKST